MLSESQGPHENQGPRESQGSLRNGNPRSDRRARPPAAAARRLRDNERKRDRDRDRDRDREKVMGPRTQDGARGQYGASAKHNLRIFRLTHDHKSGLVVRS